MAVIAVVGIAAATYISAIVGDGSNMFIPYSKFTIRE